MFHAPSLRANPHQQLNSGKLLNRSKMHTETQRQLALQQQSVIKSSDTSYKPETAILLMSLISEEATETCPRLACQETYLPHL